MPLMKLLFFCCFIFSFALFPALVLAQCNELKPMYGDNCVKTAKMRKADEVFRKSAVQQFRSADSAAHHYLQQGWLNFQQGQDEKAMKNLNQAWLLKPEAAEVYFAFGHLVRFALQKSAPEAARYYDLARQRDRTRKAEPKSYAQLIASLEKRNEPQALIDASSQLIQSFPDYKKGFGYQKRAEYYTQMQMPERAVEDWNNVIERDPQNARAFSGRGYAYYWLKQPEKALADLNQAIKTDANFAEAYAHRALLHAEANRPEPALQDAEKALNLAPDQPEFYRAKANVLLKLNRQSEACATLKNAIRKGHKSLQSFYQETCGKK